MIYDMQLTGSESSTLENDVYVWREAISGGWQRSVVVSVLAWSTKLIDTAPGYYVDGWLLTGR